MKAMPTVHSSWDRLRRKCVVWLAGSTFEGREYEIERQSAFVRGRTKENHSRQGTSWMICH